MPKKKMPPLPPAKDKKKKAKPAAPKGNPFAKGALAKGKKPAPGMNPASVPSMLPF